MYKNHIIMWTVVQEMNMTAIFAVMNTTSEGQWTQDFKNIKACRGRIWTNDLCDTGVVLYQLS